MHWQLATVAIVSGRIERTPITAAMLFTGAGLLVGDEALGLVDPAATGARYAEWHAARTAETHVESAPAGAEQRWRLQSE